MAKIVSWYLAVTSVYSKPKQTQMQARAHSLLIEATHTPLWPQWTPHQQSCRSHSRRMPSTCPSLEARAPDKTGSWAIFIVKAVKATFFCRGADTVTRHNDLVLSEESIYAPMTLKWVLPMISFSGEPKTECLSWGKSPHLWIDTQKKSSLTRPWSFGPIGKGASPLTSSSGCKGPTSLRRAPWADRANSTPRWSPWSSERKVGKTGSLGNRTPRGAMPSLSPPAHLPLPRAVLWKRNANAVVPSNSFWSQWKGSTLLSARSGLAALWW